MKYLRKRINKVYLPLKQTPMMFHTLTAHCVLLRTVAMPRTPLRIARDIQRES